MKPVVTREALQQFFRNDFPQAQTEIDAIGPGYAVLTRQPSTADLRPGGSISGPTLMAMADAASYTVVLAHIGLIPMAVTSNFNMHFFRRPEAGKELLATAKILKLGQRLAVMDVIIHYRVDDTALAQATVTYSIPSIDAGK